MNAFFDALCIIAIILVFLVKWQHDMTRHTHKKMYSVHRSDMMNRIMNDNKYATSEFILVMLFVVFASSRLVSLYFYTHIGESGMLVCTLALAAVHTYVYIENDNKKLSV